MSIPEGWKEADNALEQEFKFDDFRAMAFVNGVADLAEAENHHPDIAVSVHNRVVLRWSTHSEGGITDRDRDMAGRSAALA
jgi:4a-hydroxytetrahydrobiopterin dehydratase